MEILLQTVIIIFMLFLCALCLFAVMVIARDIIAESAARRRRAEQDYLPNQPENEIAKLVEVSVAEPIKVVEAVKAAEPVKIEEAYQEVEESKEEVASQIEEEKHEEAEDENSVTFSKSHNITVESRYAALSSEFKEYFDEVVRHALSKAGVKVNKTTSYHDYKIGAKRLVRISIKRSEVVCEFTFIDRNFNSYASANNIKVKPSATAIRVTEASAVGVAKDGIDIVFAQILEEKEHKKAFAREKRRERRRKQSLEAKENENQPKGDL